MRPLVCLALLLALLVPARSQVTINEIAAAPNERTLRYDSTGHPRLGTGPAWFDDTFNASGWSTGTAPLGMNGSGLGTDLSTALFNRTPSVYLRKTFTVSGANAASTENLRLKVDYNDGFIAFLNGREIARSRMGAAKMFAYADATAFSARPGSGFEIFDLGAANTLLRSGTNVLAIQVANFEIDAKGDLRIDAALELNNGISTTTEYSHDFNNANGAFTTHTNSGGTIGNSTTGTVPPTSWLALSPPVESSGSWTNLAVVSRLDTTGGLLGSGALRYTFSDPGTVQTAAIRGPAISLAARWPVGAVTAAMLDQTTVTFRAKTSAATMGVDFAIEPAGGPLTAALEFGRLPGQGTGPGTETIGFWRFDDPGATPGGAVTNALTQANAPTLNGVGQNSAKYSSDVPGSRIFDPISGTSYVNTYSLDATTASARISVPSHALLNSPSFTVECFIKLIGEPGGYDSFISRIVTGTSDTAANSARQGWQLDFDSGPSSTSYGKARTRFDMPGVPPPDYNRVASGGRIFVDTPSGDGNPANYTAVSDVQTVGDSINDASSNIWHHLAITYNGATRVVTFYTDYGTAASFTLNASAFAHPNAALLIGKLTNTSYELRLDEVRYTNRVLATAEMLTASNFDPNAFLTQTFKFSQATAASKSAFLAAINSANGTSVRPVFKLRADSIDSAGRSITIDDFSISFAQPSPVTPFFGPGESYTYRVGAGEPSGGVWEPNLPPVPNNPSEAGKPAAFPDLPGFSDWIELKNSGSTEVDLSGWYLTDDAGNPAKWVFPAGTRIPAGGYLLVLCDENSALPGLAYLHTNFKLSQGGERVLLFNGPTQADRVDYPRQNPFVTFGRAAANGALGYFDLGTPAGANPATVAAVERCKNPDFFADSAATIPAVGGFFTGPQTLAMTTATPGAEIRYTTDGTEPTEASLLYGGPLAVTPAGNDKTGRVFRARAFKVGAIPSDSRSITLLINQNTALKAVPALCFTGDASRNFFAPFGVSTVTGGIYDVSGIWSATANSDYHMGLKHGRAVERPVFLEWLRNDGMPGFAEEAGLRLASSPFSRPRLKLTQNAASPWPADSTQKTSFNLFFREDYGRSELDYPLFGQDYPVDTFDQLRPRAGKNDISNPFIKDEMVRRVFRAMGHVSVQGLINTLYINGSYKGIYNTVERYRDGFFDEHFGVKGKWDIRIIDATEEGDSVEWNAMLTALQQNLTNQANYDAAMNKIVLDEMIDYYLLNIYLGMWDWPNNNWVASRQRAPNGRWRFHVWDAEGSFGHGGVKPPNYDTILTDLRTNAGTGTGGLSQVFRALYASPEVRLRFADRINHWFFNGNVLDDRNPATCPLAGIKDTLKAPFIPLLNFTHGTAFSEAFWTNWTTATTANPNQGTWTTPMSNRRSHLFNNNPTPASNISFRTHGLWPATEPVLFSKHGGNVAPGFTLSMSLNATAPANSPIYYTLDGSDPRVWGGIPSSAASIYSAPIPVGGPFTRVSARVKNSSSGEWSALTTADFLIGTEPATAANLVVSKIHYHPANPNAEEMAAGYLTDEEFEFLELMAIGAAPVDLTTVKIVAGVTFDFSTAGAARVLLPGERTLIVKNRNAFQLRNGHNQDTKIAGTYLGTLSNSGEQLWLTGVDGPDADTAPDDIKRFTYDDDLPWPGGPDGNGPSLVLVRPETNPNHALPQSWRSGLALGGGPGENDSLSYAAWAAIHGITDPTGAGDLDGDGITNLVEYFLGTNPKTASSCAQPVSRMQKISVQGVISDYLTTSFTRALGRDEAGFSAQASTLVASGWSPAVLVSATYDIAGTETLTYRCPQPMNANSQQFLRVEVTRP